MNRFRRPDFYGKVPHAPDAPALELHNIYVTYRANGNGPADSDDLRYALQDVSFQVGTAEQVAVVGPNGAGKSTLFKLVSGILKPARGEILTYGHAPDRHICIAYVPQRIQLDRTFPVTVADIVMMGRVGQIGLFRRPRGADWAHVRASLNRVNAGHLAGLQVGELSGGQQQRVLIARALAQEAEILLLDEPLSGLDVPSQRAIFDILEGLRVQEVTVLVATHDLTLAAERFDRVMLLNKRLVAFAGGQSVLTTENLLATYGAQLHHADEGGSLVLSDTCCDDDEIPLPPVRP